jgi:hypothetical protein
MNRRILILSVAILAAAFVAPVANAQLPPGDGGGSAVVIDPGAGGGGAVVIDPGAGVGGAVVIEPGPGLGGAHLIDPGSGAAAQLGKRHVSINFVKLLKRR